MLNKYLLLSEGKAALKSNSSVAGARARCAEFKKGCGTIGPNAWGDRSFGDVQGGAPRRGTAERGFRLDAAAVHRESSIAPCTGSCGPAGGDRAHSGWRASTCRGTGVR